MDNGDILVGGNPVMDHHPVQRGVVILLGASSYGNRYKLRQSGPLARVRRYLSRNYNGILL